MAPQFNLHADFTFQLVANNGDVLLTSSAFEDKDSAIAAIWSLREAAAQGRIVDLTRKEA